MKNLKPNFFYQLTITFLQTVVPLITFPYVSRVLSPDAIGKINFIDYIIQFLLVVSAFGIPMYGAREVSRLRHNKEAIRKLISEVVSIHVCITVACFLLFAVALFLSPNAFLQPSLIALALINLAVNAFSIDWMIQGLEDFAFVSKRTVVIRLLVVLCIFLFVRAERDFTIYYALLVAGSLLIVGTDLFYAYRKNLFSLSFQNPWRHLRPLSIFFFTTAAISIYSFLDTFILGIVAGSLAVGFYTTALKTVKLSQNFVNDLGGVLLPRISYLFEQNEQQEIERILNKSLLYVFTIAIPLGIFFFTAAPEIIYVLAGDKYALSVTTLQILSPLPFIIGLSNVFGIQVLIPFQKEKAMLVAVSAGSMVSIVICILLCPAYKQEGAALACVGAEIAVTLIVFFHARKLNHFQLPVRQWLQVLFASGLFIPVVTLLRNSFDTQLSTLIFSILACGLLYLLLQLFIFSNMIVKEMVNFATSGMGFLKN